MNPNATLLTPLNLDQIPRHNFESIFNNPKNGQVVKTTLTRIGAQTLVKHSFQRTQNNFAKDIASKANLSEAQAYYLFKMAEDEFAFIKRAQSGEVQEEKIGEYIKICELFGAAKQLTRPIVRFEIEGDKIAISKAPATGKNPNCLYVKNNGIYAGKIDANGNFYPSKECAEVTKSYLLQLTQNPVQCAKSYGRLTGKCCFCGLTLTDERSVKAGYGAICADHWGLPWGSN